MLLLVHAVSLNGNFLLNFGPKGDGTFRPEEQRLAAEIGAWMKTDGQAIYGCGYAGLKKQDWGYFTRNEKTGKIHMVVCNIPVSGWLRVQVPRGKSVAGATRLDNATPLNIEKFDGDEFFVILDNKSADRPFVITLDLK